jgi:hypothetical protein
MTIKLGQSSRPLPISSLIRERISNSSGRKRVYAFKSPYEEDLGGSLLPDKMDKSVDVLNMEIN